MITDSKPGTVVYAAIITRSLVYAVNFLNYNIFDLNAFSLFKCLLC